MEKERYFINFKTGFISITPKTPVPLGGYGHRKKNYEAISDELEINCIIFKYESDLFCFVSADLLFVTKEIKKQLSAELNIKQSHIFLGASHTHFAPNIDKSKPKLGKVSKNYLSYLHTQIQSLCRDLNQKIFQNGTLHYNASSINLSISRRKKAWYFYKRFLLKYGIFMHPNPNQKIDQTCHSIVVKDKKDIIQSLLWCYPCHPTQFPENNNVSSDFPGKARSFLRDHYHSKFPIIYFQGFSGDVRPALFDKKRTFKSSILKYLNKNSQLFGQCSNKDYQIWTNALCKNLLSQINKKSDAFLPQFKIISKNISLRKFIKNLVLKDKFLTAQIVKLSEQISFIGFNAEMVSEYSNILNDKFSKIQIPVGCLDDTFGYLPTSKMIKEGGYESKTFFNGFGLSGQYFCDVVTILKEEVTRL